MSFVKLDDVELPKLPGVTDQKTAYLFGYSGPDFQYMAYYHLNCNACL